MEKDSPPGKTISDKNGHYDVDGVSVKNKSEPEVVVASSGNAPDPRPEDVEPPSRIP